MSHAILKNLLPIGTAVGSKQNRMYRKSFLVVATLFSLYSCGKSNGSASSSSSHPGVSDSVWNLPLASIPHTSQTGRVVNLEAYKSTGPIVRYKWERIDTAVINQPTTFASATEFSDPTKASVVKVNTTKLGWYVFQLTVYDEKGNSNVQFISDIVSQ